MSHRFRALTLFVATIVCIHTTFFGPVHSLSNNSNNNVAIRVCQNKHCCKRAGKGIDVLQTVNNLLVVQQQVDGDGDSDKPAVAVDSVNCLSNCDMGPNVEITFSNGTSVVLHDMVNAQQAAVHLYELAVVGEQQQGTAAADATTTTVPAYSPPKVLLAATKVMETSQQLASIDVRIRYLTSVITKLESSSSCYSMSAANAHAHALRAQAYYDESINNADDEALQKAVMDAKYVTRDLRFVATEASVKMAYRSWVDAERAMAASSNRSSRGTATATATIDYSRAVSVLQEWYQAQPNFRTKLQREIQELQQQRT